MFDIVPPHQHQLAFTVNIMHIHDAQPDLARAGSAGHPDTAPEQGPPQHNHQQHDHQNSHANRRIEQRLVGGIKIVQKLHIFKSSRNLDVISR